MSFKERKLIEKLSKSESTMKAPKKQNEFYLNQLGESCKSVIDFKLLGLDEKPFNFENDNYQTFIKKIVAILDQIFSEKKLEDNNLNISSQVVTGKRRFLKILLKDYRDGIAYKKPYWAANIGLLVFTKLVLLSIRDDDLEKKEEQKDLVSDPNLIKVIADFSNIEDLTDSRLNKKVLINGLEVFLVEIADIPCKESNGIFNICQRGVSNRILGVLIYRDSACEVMESVEAFMLRRLNKTLEERLLTISSSFDNLGKEKEFIKRLKTFQEERNMGKISGKASLLNTIFLPKIVKELKEEFEEIRGDENKNSIIADYLSQESLLALQLPIAFELLLAREALANDPKMDKIFSKVEEEFIKYEKKRDKESRLVTRYRDRLNELISRYNSLIRKRNPSKLILKNSYLIQLFQNEFQNLWKAMTQEKELPLLGEELDNYALGDEVLSTTLYALLSTSESHLSQDNFEFAIKMAKHLNQNTTLIKEHVEIILSGLTLNQESSLEFTSVYIQKLVTYGLVIPRKAWYRGEQGCSYQTILDYLLNFLESREQVSYNFSEKSLQSSIPKIYLSVLKEKNNTFNTIFQNSSDQLSRQQLCCLGYMTNNISLLMGISNATHFQNETEVSQMLLEKINIFDPALSREEKRGLIGIMITLISNPSLKIADVINTLNAITSKPSNKKIIRDLVKHIGVMCYTIEGISRLLVILQSNVVSEYRKNDFLSPLVSTAMTLFTDSPSREKIWKRVVDNIGSDTHKKKVMAEAVLIQLAKMIFDTKQISHPTQQKKIKQDFTRVLICANWDQNKSVRDQIISVFVYIVMTHKIDIYDSLNYGGLNQFSEHFPTVLQQLIRGTGVASYEKCQKNASKLLLEALDRLWANPQSKNAEFIYYRLFFQKALINALWDENQLIRENIIPVFAKALEKKYIDICTYVKEDWVINRLPSLSLALERIEHDSNVTKDVRNVGRSIFLEVIDFVIKKNDHALLVSIILTTEKNMDTIVSKIMEKATKPQMKLLINSILKDITSKNNSLFLELLWPKLDKSGVRDHQEIFKDYNTYQLWASCRTISFPLERLLTSNLLNDNQKKPSILKNMEAIVLNWIHTGTSQKNHFSEKDLMSLKNIQNRIQQLENKEDRGKYLEKLLSGIISSRNITIVGETFGDINIWSYSDQSWFIDKLDDTLSLLAYVGFYKKGSSTNVIPCNSKFYLREINSMILRRGAKEQYRMLISAEMKLLENEDQIINKGGVYVLRKIIYSGKKIINRNQYFNHLIETLIAASSNPKEHVRTGIISVCKEIFRPVINYIENKDLFGFAVSRLINAMGDKNSHKQKVAVLILKEIVDFIVTVDSEEILYQYFDGLIVTMLNQNDSMQAEVILVLNYMGSAIIKYLDFPYTDQIKYLFEERVITPLIQALGEKNSQQAALLALRDLVNTIWGEEPNDISTTFEEWEPFPRLLVLENSLIKAIETNENSYICEGAILTLSYMSSVIIERGIRYKSFDDLLVRLVDMVSKHNENLSKGVSRALGSMANIIAKKIWDWDTRQSLEKTKMGFLEPFISELEKLEDEGKALFLESLFEQENQSLLYHIMEYGNDRLFEFFVDIFSSSDYLNNSTKKSFLNAIILSDENGKQLNGLTMALLNQHESIATRYIQLILESQLTFQRKQDLLCASISAFREAFDQLSEDEQKKRTYAASFFELEKGFLKGDILDEKTRELDQEKMVNFFLSYIPEGQQEDISDNLSKVKELVFNQVIHLIISQKKESIKQLLEVLFQHINLPGNLKDPDSKLQKANKLFDRISDAILRTGKKDPINLLISLLNEKMREKHKRLFSPIDGKEDTKLSTGTVNTSPLFELDAAETCLTHIYDSNSLLWKLSSREELSESLKTTWDLVMKRIENIEKKQGNDTLKRGTSRRIIRPLEKLVTNIFLKLSCEEAIAITGRLIAKAKESQNIKKLLQSLWHSYVSIENHIILSRVAKIVIEQALKSEVDYFLWLLCDNKSSPQKSLALNHLLGGFLEDKNMTGFNTVMFRLAPPRTGSKDGRKANSKLYIMKGVIETKGDKNQKQIFIQVLIQAIGGEKKDIQETAKALLNDMVGNIQANVEMFQWFVRLLTSRITDSNENIQNHCHSILTNLVELNLKETDKDRQKYLVEVLKSSTTKQAENLLEKIESKPQKKKPKRQNKKSTTAKKKENPMSEITKGFQAMSQSVGELIEIFTPLFSGDLIEEDGKEQKKKKPKRQNKTSTTDQKKENPMSEIAKGFQESSKGLQGFSLCFIKQGAVGDSNPKEVTDSEEEPRPNFRKAWRE